MDNVTHGLWGLGIYAGWAAVSHPTPHSGLATGVCVAAIAASEAPDFDYLVRLIFGPVAYLRQHRAISHSIPMWFIWPLIIALLVSLVWPGHFWLLFLISFIAVIIHVGLDILTTYGTQALWPFSRRRFALDALFIVDAVMLICGILGWIMTLVGKWTVGHSVFLMGSIVLFYLAFRCVHAAYLYNRVRQQFPESWGVSTIPGPLPWWWSFVAQSDGELMAGRVSVTGTVQREIHWIWQDRDDDAVRFATRFSRVGSVFHWFSRHLIWAQSSEGINIRISFADATYRYGQTLPFTAYVVLKKLESGRYVVQEESLRGQSVDWKALLADASLADSTRSSRLRMPTFKR